MEERSSFEILEQISENTNHCIITYPGDVKVHASVRSFKEQKEAVLYMKRLTTLTGPSIIKFREYLIRDEVHYVFCENIVSFNTWLGNRSKKMWQFFNKECVGFGANFKKVFSQIGVALEGLHKDKFRHRRLLNGVCFGEDGNIRLFNFECVDLDYANDTEYLLKDLKDFGQLVRQAVEAHPLPLCNTRGNLQPVDEVVDEVRYLYLLFDKLNQVGVKHQAPYIYKASAFWSIQTTFIFFDTFKNLYDDNALFFKEQFKFGSYFNWDWGKKIPKGTALRAVFDYADHRAPAPRHTKKATCCHEVYKTSYGPPIFMRNCFQHLVINYWEDENTSCNEIKQYRYSKEHVLHEVLQIFPQLVAVCFLVVAESDWAGYFVRTFTGKNLEIKSVKDYFFERLFKSDMV